MPRWLDVAQKYEGTKEVRGKSANPIILGWLQGPGKGKGWVKDDATPWCGAFMAGIFTESGLAHVVPKEPLVAANWRTAGVALEEPREGCIGVIPRNDKNNPNAAHVFLVVAFNAHTIWALGGNQEDRATGEDEVNITTFKRLNANGSERAVYRWPVEIKTPSDLEADGSRIAKRARRAARDMQISSGSGTSPVTAPAASEYVPTLPSTGIRDTVDGLVGDVSWIRGTLETVGEFASFAGARWPVLAVIVAAYFGARVLWDTHLVREYRAQDHNEGFSS